MVDLKISKLQKKPNKFLFKKRLTLRRKSKGKLVKESFLMFLLSIIIFYLNYLIPKKDFIFRDFFKNVSSLGKLFSEMFYYFYNICLSLLIVLSLTFAVILFLGALIRILKVAKRKTKFIPYK